jgi:site-specific DNA recombinase
MSNNYAILLVRVSTSFQDYDPQIDDLKKYALTKGYKNLKIIETKESGLIDMDKKVGTNQLFSFINENPKYRVVFTTEISRLGRRQSILHQIKEWFIKNKIQLFVKDVGYSLFDENENVTIAGEMMFSLYGLFAEAEVKQRKDRFKRAKQSLMEKGYSISGKELFGYKRVKGDGDRNTYILHPENSKVVRTIFNWYINGIDRSEKNVSIRRISMECIKKGYPKYTHSKRNVNKLLKEEGYTGEKITNNKRKNIFYEDGSSDEKYVITNNRIKYPVIINRETFDQAQNCLKEKNSKVDKSTKKTTLLSKLIKCEKCQSHYSGNYRNVNGLDRSSYRCSSRSGTNFCKNTKSIGMQLLDNAIWSLIKTDYYLLSKVLSNYNPNNDIESLKNSKMLLEQRFAEIDSEVSLLNDSIKGISSFNNISGISIISTLESKLKKFDKEKGRLLNQISKIENQLLSIEIDFSNLSNTVQPNIELVENSKELLKKYINLFISKIYIVLHNTRYTIIEVDFNFHSYHPITELSQINIDNNAVVEIKPKTWIILDKRITQNVVAYKITEELRLSADKCKIIIKDKNKKKKIEHTIQLDELPMFKSKQLIDEFTLYKLKSFNS